MPTIFSKIIAGDIPCHKVAENEHCLAFLDISPIARGHVLVVPKEEIDYFFDLSDTLLVKVMTFSKTVARALEQVVPCERIGVSVIGLEVPHAHVHLVPITNLSDMSFSNERLKITQKEMAKLADEIHQTYLAL